MTIRLDPPRRFDLVGNPILIGGIGTGFEATINYRVHDGHDEVTGSVTAGGGTGELAQHVVKPGDTLTKIARKHYGNTNFGPVMRANVHQVDDPDLIVPGRLLRVPIGSG